MQLKPRLVKVEAFLKMKKITPKNLLYVIAIFSWIAVVGSLYLSFFGDPVANIQDGVLFDRFRALIPCELCWYQRMFVYPVAIISTLGIFLKDKKVFYYILPFPIITVLIATYHVYIQAFPTGIIPCNSLVPCDQKEFEYLGFITIPVLSLIYTVIVTALTMLAIKLNRKAD